MAINTNILSVRSCQKNVQEIGHSQTSGEADEDTASKDQSKDLRLFIFFYLYKKEDNDMSVYAVDFMQNKKNVKTVPVIEFLSEVVSI